MKKIFTFVAATMLGVCANAQEILKLDSTATYLDGAVLSTANASVTLGNDMKKVEEGKENTGWTNEPAEVAGEYLADFLAAFKNKDGKDTTCVVQIHGDNNPKDGTTSGAGSGVDCSDGKTTASLPQNGTYYIFKAETAGTVQFGVVLNNGKGLYVLDSTDAYEDNGKIRITLPDNNIKDYVMKDGKGEKVDMEDGDKGSLVVDKKTIGFVEFDAVAGHSYYIFCSGSKLGFWGYKFITGTDGISSAVAAESVNAPAYNLAGQQVDAQYKGVVIKNGQKLIQK